MPLTHLFEISFDPLSDTTPTWVDFSDYLLEAESTLGVSGDLDQAEYGSATFRVDDRRRFLEPEHTGSPHSPNVTPLRRVRWRIDDGVTTHDIFHGYVVDWGPSWPGGLMNQEAVVKCVDGHALLALDKLALLDPPSVSTYEEVVLHDRSWGYWRMNDEIADVLQDSSGNNRELAFAYELESTLGREGAIVGDTDRRIEFGDASTYADLTRRFLRDGATALTVECWYEPTAQLVSATEDGIAFLINQSLILATWSLFVEGSKISFHLRTRKSPTGPAAGTKTTVTDPTSFVVGTLYHIVATYDGVSLRLYINGELVDEEPCHGSIPISWSSGVSVSIGQALFGVSDFNVDVCEGFLDEFALYGHALTAERVMAHYQAGAERGFPEQTAGERIAALATSALWATTDIQAGAHDVQAVMEHGQSRINEIVAAAKAEMPASLFYFPGTENPRYLGWEYRATAPYNEPAATFGNQTGEVPFEDLQVVYDDEMFNIVTVSHQTSDEGEASHTAFDQDSIDNYYDRAFPENPISLTLVHHDDAEAVAGAILSDHSQPQVRFSSISLPNLDANAEAQILTRLPGDLIRVKHRPQGGTALDIVTHILGRNLRLNPGEGGRARVLECDWSLARGFNAAAGYWQAGIVGFSEAGSTTKAK